MYCVLCHLQVTTVAGVSNSKPYVDHNLIEKTSTGGKYTGPSKCNFFTTEIFFFFVMLCWFRVFRQILKIALKILKIAFITALVGGADHVFETPELEQQQFRQQQQQQQQQKLITSIFH